MPLSSGARLGVYEVIAQIGAGGMGEVYKAIDSRLDRTVAIKVLPVDAARDRSFRERFEREARAVSRLNHPHICTVHDIGQQGETDFLVMEYLEGETLADRLARGPMPLAETIPHALAMLSAVGALHQGGLIHRDLKPANLFLTAHGLKLLDFGIARPLQEEMAQTITNMTEQGVLIGTPQYMSPEALLGQKVDTRADLFAAGVIIFEMLTGKPPFAGESIGELIQAVTRENTPVLRGADAVAAVDRVLHRALAKRPADRYEDADAMADELRQTLLVSRESGEHAVAQRMTRLIVLPFRVLRPDEEIDFLAFSLSDAITASLSGLEGLVVRSSLAASQFSSGVPNLKAIAQEADVDIVLVGTLLRAGDRLRVSAQLLEAPAGTVLWSHGSQVAMGDIFQLQDDLTHRIVDSLSLPLTAREHALLRRDMPVSAKAYEHYLRANELSLDSKQWALARDFYHRCLEEDPQYAPAWARLGRIYRVIAKFFPDEESDQNLGRAETAFQRALEVNPDLPIAHSLYASLEVELGRAPDATRRLVERAKVGGADPELFAGLVHACRYCGLLEASVAAHEHAKRLDPKIPTSVVHTYLLLGRPDRALMPGITSDPFIKGLALMALGRHKEAIAETHERGQIQHLRRFLVALGGAAAGDREKSLAAINEILESSFRDPEGWFYLARLLAYQGELDQAVSVFARAVDGGFYCFPAMTRDPWLDPVRARPEFTKMLRVAETRYREAAAAFLETGGDRVLGVETRL